MLSLARHCRSSLILLQVRQLLANSSTNCTRNGLFRSYTNILWRREPIRNNLKLVNHLRSNTIAVRLCSNIPSKNKKSVGYWLLTCGGMVFVAVVLGGVTRLTESGLSMVTWRLLGEKMPITDREWQEEFKKYQEYPEFKMKNSQMTLNEFKWIWYMEFAHRMWGRAIGGVFLIPAVYFWTTGKFSKAMKKRVLIFGGLIAAQGLMGWYMVQSGLEDRFHKQTDVPRVSQYRLASHLGLALVLYSGFLWSALDYLLPSEELKCSNQKLLKGALKFKGMAHGCKALVFLTALSGAFVAGLDAGLVYNSFPKMADKWIPDDILAFTPKLSNFTENPTTVQFDHRILGCSTLGYITVLYLMSRRRVLPRRAYTAAAIVATIAWLQVGLGISTLLTYVPTGLAACHQSGSLALLSAAIWLSHELKKIPK